MPEHYTIFFRKDRDKWGVRWFQGGVKKRRFFDSKNGAETFVSDQKKLARFGGEAGPILAAQRVAAGSGYTVAELIAAGLEYLKGLGAQHADLTMTFEKAADAVIARAEEQGARPRTLDSYRRTYSVLCDDFGTRMAAVLTHDEVKAHLDRIPDRAGRVGKGAYESKLNALRYIRMAMRIAGIGNPLPKLVVMAKPHELDCDVEYFTLDESKLMFECAPPEARGFLAIAMFAAIRPENLELLKPDCISVADQRIRIPASIAKDRKTHILDRDYLPPLLWTWLERYPYQQVNWRQLQQRLRRKIGRWVHDGVRHTGATYYCAIHGTAKTAHLLTHATEDLVRRHYAGTIESATARKFYEMGPDSMRFDPPKVNWPADADLALMLCEKPAYKVAAIIGVSDVAISKRCKERGIPKPGRGEWTKKLFIA
jgi:hypothetical protein